MGYGARKRKPKEKKREVGRKKRTPPSPNRIGVGVLLLLSACALGDLLSPKASPSLLLFILEVLGFLRHNFATCNSNLFHPVLPLDRISAELGRSRAGVDHHHHRRAVTLRENSSTYPSLLLNQEGRDRHRAVRVLNAEVPSVRR